MNRKSLNFTILIMSLFLLITIGSLYAKGPENVRSMQSFYKTSALNPTRTLSNINNWAYWLYYDGKSGIDPNGNGGGIYPRGTSNVIYQDGVVWGALVPTSDTTKAIRVGGATYRTGTSAVFDQIYRIRSDWASLTRAQVKEDASEFFEVPLESVTDEQADQIIEQYKLDWKNWPVDEGAPYIDVNDNGVYEPVLDENGMADPNKGDYPGIASADQVIFFVVDDSDAGRTTQLYGSDPMGIELQVTMWGYNQKEARLGQLMFKKYKLINKSDVTFDSMYVAQWCDPDVGTYTDDLVGCDPDLGLGFAYNGGPTDDEFDRFGVAPSAMGYDFFQGPIVDGVANQDINHNGIDDAEDYAVFNLKRVGPGKVNIPMTSFGYFSAGNTEWGDPRLGSYDGTLQWYNLLRGFITNTDVENPTPFTHRATGEVTKFPLDGDPAAGTGDLDGQGANFAAADRRMSLSTGPFSMAPGDEQEIVVAVIGGNGSDYINSVVQVKETDKLAQKLYDDLFATIPKAPPAPQVVASPFENTIVLSWGDDPEAVSRTEDTKYPDSDSTEYTFQGYNVYQISYGLNAQTKLIGTFDVIDGVKTIEQPKFLEEYGVSKVVPVQFGKDSGVKRYFVVDKNYLTDDALFPGNTYYFAVTAYNYNPDPQLIQDKALESSMIVIPVQTQTPGVGKRVTSKPGDNVLAVHSDGGSDGQVAVVVIDPTKVTGDKYEIFFSEDADTNSSTFGEILWNVKNTVTGDTIVKNQLQATDLNAQDQPIFDGIQVKVAGPSLDFKAFQTVANAAGPINPPEGAAADFQNFPSLRPTSGQQVGTGYWMFQAGGGDGSYESFLARVMRGDNFNRAVPYDFEMRFTKRGSWAVRAFNDGAVLKVPFELWNTGINTPDDPSDDYRLIPWFLSSGLLGLNQTDPNGMTYQLDPNDHPGSGGTNDPYTPWIYWRQPEDVSYGEVGYNNYLADIDTVAGTYGSYSFNSPEVMARTVLMSWNADDVADGEIAAGVQMVPEEGTVFRIITTKPNTLADKFTFSAPVVEQSIAYENEDAKKVTVFPNPYYAGNSQESGRFDRFVTFYHLPKKATIRIFNLAGEQVRKLETPLNNTSQFLKWDLRNDNSLPVASGMYFAYVDMTLSDGSKATKVLKLFIIQRRQQLEFF